MYYVESGTILAYMLVCLKSLVISLDYQSYMGSCMTIWSLRWLFLYMCSYNLGGSITVGKQVKTFENLLKNAKSMLKVLVVPCDTYWSYPIWNRLRESLVECFHTHWSPLVDTRELTLVCPKTDQPDHHKALELSSGTPKVSTGASK
jgi:hypothetical protein